MGIFEVGIGGDLDCTNVFAHPAATAVPLATHAACLTRCTSQITSIGLDHTDLLGDTLPSIAAHKAGIFKPGVKAFTHAEDAPVHSVIHDHATAVGVCTFVLSPTADAPPVCVWTESIRGLLAVLPFLPPCLWTPGSHTCCVQRHWIAAGTSRGAHHTPPHRLTMSSSRRFRQPPPHSTHRASVPTRPSRSRAVVNGFVRTRRNFSSRRSPAAHWKVCTCLSLRRRRFSLLRCGA